MAASKGEETALGTARGRFIESLPRKAIELRGAIALLTATPAAEGPREDMRRRLHTLYASALVFRNDALAGAVKEGIDRLDAARDGGRSLSGDDLDLLTRLIKRIPELRGDGAEGSSERAAVAQPSTPAAAPASRAPRPLDRTLTGLAPAAILAQALTADRRSVTRPPDNHKITFAETKGSPVLQRVLTVLVLAPAEAHPAYTKLFAGESFAIALAASVSEAIDAARAHAPDVVAADAKLAKDGVLIGALRSDPLTDFIPVVLIETKGEALDGQESRALGADDIITRPFDRDRVVRVLGRVTGTLVESGAQLATLGEATLSELAERVADEIRRGIVEAAETGRDLKVQLGEGAEVLAAAWAAVARVRAFVTQQSGGKVQFSDRALRSGPKLLALGKQGVSTQEIMGESPLRGRRILVVDDDTAVVWFFAGVLREEGATVLEATDGREALAAARRERPDVVISDVLMPALDGFGLCRELKRDPLLSDVPVILISWKEDLLLRMRELSAGASGYLRKEAGAAHILASVREVLRARVELETQLKASAEVRGNLEGTGIVALLRSVRRTRPDARIVVRDAFSHFDCELRDGRLAQLTRTASDGNFTRGERALPLLLGVSAGRFSVLDAEGPLKPAFEGTLDEVLTRGARELGALLDAVSPRSLSRTARVVLDEDAYNAMLKQAPTGVRRIVERLHAGEPPSQLLVKDPVSASLLESLLSELARRGAVRGVVGTGGEDLVAEAKQARGAESPTELASPMSLLPPPPNPVISVIEQQPASAGKGLPNVLDPMAASAAPAQPPKLPSPVPEAHVEGPTDDEDEAFKADTDPPKAPEAHAERAAGAQDEEAPTNQFEPLSKAAADGVIARASDRPPAPDGDGRASEPPAVPASPADVEPGVAASASAPERAVFDEPPAEQDLLATEERRSKSTIAGWTVALVVLFAIGFLLSRSELAGAPAEVEALGKRAAGGASSATKAKPVVTATPEPAKPVEPGTPAQAAPEPTPAAVPGAVVVPRDVGIEIVDGIRDPSIKVNADQGLLIVEAGPRIAGAELLVDGARVGAAPAKLPLSEGIHELAFSRGDAVTYRFVSVRRAKTFVLRDL